MSYYTITTFRFSGEAASFMSFSNIKTTTHFKTCLTTNLHKRWTKSSEFVKDQHVHKYFTRCLHIKNDHAILTDKSLYRFYYTNRSSLNTGTVLIWDRLNA